MWIALAAHVAVLWFVRPASPWEFDEPLFFQALRNYDPAAHHPPPPGYPLFIFVGKLVRLLVDSDFTALLALSIAASIIGFVLLALAFRELANDETTGVIAALFFYWSPAMLIHSTLPISEPGALALLAAALYFGSGFPVARSPGHPAEATHRETGRLGNRATIPFAIFAALTIGWRIQFAIFVVPLFLVAVAMMRTWRARFISLGVFTVACLAWLVPLTLTLGGVRELIDFETGQGAYLIAHDAAESRTGWTPVRIAFRFIGRPWGTELTALAMLALAALGFIVAIRRRMVPALPLAAGALVYIAAALWVMDPADGVRYAIPFTLATAFLAGVGARFAARRFAYAVPVAALIAFLAYVGPLLWQRHTITSPPVYSAMVALKMFGKGANALYELPLWPHADYFLGPYHRTHRVDDGLAKFWNRPDVPLYIYADGASSRPGAVMSRWKWSDAYVKMTRNHYRVVSIIPLPPHRRFRIVRGIYAPEREQDGMEWRWLDDDAELQLPSGPARTLKLRLRLPPAAAIESNVIRVVVNGQPAGQAVVTRPDRTDVAVAVPAGAPFVRVDAERTFIPAEVPSMRSGDRRRLAVELLDLWTSPAR